MPKKLGLWAYVKGAFNVRLPLKGLGGVPVNWLALAGVGVASVALPALLPIGLGLELAYLTMTSHDKRFRKVIEGKEILKENASWQESKQRRARSLRPEHGRRLEALERRVARLRELSADAAGMTALRQGSINRLVWIYLRLLQSKEVIEAQMTDDIEAKVALDIAAKEKQLTALKERGATDENPVAKSLSGTLEILRRRSENLRAAGDRLRYIDAELTRVEQQVELIIEETAFSKDEAHLSARIDSVATTLDDANSWMAANADLLGDVADDDIEPPPIAVEES